MSLYRNSRSRKGAVITALISSSLAFAIVFGDSVASAQPPTAPDEAAVLESQPAPTVAPGLSRLLASYQRTPSRTRLASVPKMFGDSLGNAVGIAMPAGRGGQAVDVGIPIGSSRASKVGDHNAALPVDRVYFNYNHFHNALNATVGANPITALDSQSINRYTFGWEKTFHEGLWSVELRMPFTDTYGLGIPGSLGAPFGIAAGGGNVGNLSVVLKRMIHETDDMVVALGLVLDTPTGEDTFTTIDTTNYRIDNSVMGILPYIGMLYMPCDRHFVNAFAQMDIPLGDNTVRTSDTMGVVPPAVLGNFTQPTWLYLDVSGGYWLYRDASAAHVTGLAALLEFHYTTTLHHGQALQTSPNFGDVTFSPTRGTLYSDVVNMTVALNAQLANDWVVRVGGIVPLSSNHRFFDAEVAVQATRYF